MEKASRAMADADLSHRKYPEMSAPIVKLDLEAQIARAEQAVIERDQRIRQRVESVAHRVRREAIKHAGGGLLVGVGTVVLAWWLKHLHRRHAPPPAAAAASGEAPQHSTAEHLFRDVGILLASLLPMVWPMLPRAWRRVVSPGTASSMLTFLAPLLGKLFRRKTPQAQSS